MLNKTPLKIIFLDIDGVLVTHCSMGRGLCPKTHLHHYQKSCVQELNRVIRKTGALIVLSATCRKHREYGSTLQHIEDEGIIGHVIGRTGGSDDRIRGHEIQDWLDQYPYRHHIGSFVILDDDSDMDRLMGRLVLTSMDGGMRRCHGDHALTILNRTWRPK